MMEERPHPPPCEQLRDVEGGGRWNGNELLAVGLHTAYEGLVATGDYSAAERTKMNYIMFCFVFDQLS